VERKQDPRKVLEQKYDPRLDKLYTSNVKCPYCKKRIPKLQTTCDQCGLNKIQIAYASNARAKQMMKSGERGKIVMMRRRPSDLILSSLCLRLVLGIFGWHNFYTGRKIRGWIMLGCMLAFILWFILQNNIPAMAEHPLWGMDSGEASPLIFLSTISLVLWISDIFGIMFGWYKYPVRLGEVNDAGKVWAK